MSAPLAAAVDFQARPTTTAFQFDNYLSKHQVCSCNFDHEPSAGEHMFK